MRRRELLLVRKVIQAWLVLSLVLLIGVASGSAPPQAKSGPHGGVLGSVGALTVEVRLWETFVEVFAYDPAERPYPADELRGTLEVLRTSSPATRRRHAGPVKLRSHGDALRASIELGPVQYADLKLSLWIDGRRHEGTIKWKKSEDKSRHGDWPVPPLK